MSTDVPLAVAVHALRDGKALEVSTDDPESIIWLARATGAIIVQCDLENPDVLTVTLGYAPTGVTLQ